MNSRSRFLLVAAIALIGGTLVWASRSSVAALSSSTSSPSTQSISKFFAAAEETAANYGEVLAGDANLDGSVDVVDVTTVVDFILGKATPTDAQKANADVNNDGSVDVVDLTSIVDIILGKA